MAKKIIDLTFPIHEGMTTFPVSWHPFVEISQMGRHHIEHRETRKLVLGTHTGTHCDAPRHFIPAGKTIDQIPLETLMGPAALIDLTDIKPKAEISLFEIQKRIGALRPQRLVLRYGWSSHWKKEDYYSGHPFLSEEAARWLAGRGLKLIAMDTPMPDDPLNGRGSKNDSPIHKIFLGKNIILVEYLCNLDKIKKRNFELIVLPLKVAGADGAPCRCVAIED